MNLSTGFRTPQSSKPQPFSRMIRWLQLPRPRIMNMKLWNSS